MRYIRESFNNGTDIIESEYSEHVEDVETAISETDYQFKHCNENGREHELIFDPTGANKFLHQKFEELGWETEVNLENQGFDTGRDIDIYKQSIGGEIQFAHYSSLDSDMNRLQRLYNNVIFLENDRDVEAAVIIVVRQDMPRSNSVSHFQQAINRAAPESLTSIPTIIYGISRPKNRESVKYNYYRNPKERKIYQQQEIDFKVNIHRNDMEYDVYPGDERDLLYTDENQSGISDYF